ncbi:hypothetical protein IMCC3317_22610 [Kordia antarctica]|uniref:Uncharacterized protein n=1 Tax=Kordia antarctica TaxID=1218801 RepID=A0A7L4ZK58_9FLAO|nr:hypothetical protein [Kordia antarctica]QHI36891.1 hypothetical protein IMCC3317_22610 [Kordia antarctica]
MQNLIDGFKSVELEERLEMVHLTALAEKEGSYASDIDASPASADIAQAPISE